MRVCVRNMLYVLPFLIFQQIHVSCVMKHANKVKINNDNHSDKTADKSYVCYSRIYIDNNILFVHERLLAIFFKNL